MSRAPAQLPPTPSLLAPPEKAEGKTRGWRRWVSSALAALAVSGALANCGGSKRGPLGENYAYELAPPPKGRPTDSLGRVRPDVESFLVATVPERTIGPFLARRDNAAMVAYLASEGGARKVMAAPLTAQGKLVTPGRVVATASGDVDMLVLRPTGGNRAGFVGLWTSLTDHGEALELMGIADDGGPRGQPLEVARTNDDIVWVEAVRTSRGAICVWAEETRDDTANIFGVALDTDGKPRGVATPIAKGVTGWQAVPTTMGAGLALATRTSGLLWMKLDGEARPIGAPDVIVPKSFSGTDMDVARVGNAWVFAWTDRSGFDPQVMMASLDEGMHPADGDKKSAVKGPAPAITSLGGARFVGLVALGEEGVALAWDETGRSGRLHLTKLEPSGKYVQDASIALELEGNAPPLMAAAGRGVGLLVNGRACLRTSTTQACSAISPGPMFVRLDEKLAPVQVEPLRLRDDRIASLGWGLDCGASGPRDARGDGHCLALVAVPEAGGAGVDAGSAGAASSQVHALNLAARASPYRAPLAAEPPPDAPRPLTLT
ncbi:MAG TPA: hypothetical protein VNO21_15305, partial [Polyangiaceae bacterium]|nr:hypothetical protein [Polyangiaceae bacterium]